MNLNVKKLTKDQQAVEWYKCKTNFFYFLYTYVYIPEIGGLLKYDQSITHSKIKHVVRSIFTFHKCIFLASRQLGKSTIAAALLCWATNFFPKVPAIILNANKNYALENLEKVKFIHENLPHYLRVPLKNKGDRKTYIEYAHGSKLSVFYPSAGTSASTLARSLTSPILYVDECA